MVEQFSVCMESKFLKIYIYPIFILIASLAPWYFFAKFVLKINIEALVLQSLNGSETSLKCFKLFFLLICITIYIIWVGLNKWKEKDPDRRLNDFFIAYGKIFALIISLQFLAFIVLVLI